MIKLNIPKELYSLLAEETGWHIGDGSMNFYKNNGTMKGLYQLRGHFKDDRQHYEKRILNIYKKIYGINISLRSMVSTGVYGFQIWSNDIVIFKNKILGLPLGKKGEIKIPDIFLQDKEMTKSVIRGIFDTDGCFYLQKKSKGYYPRIKITTTSKNLANQLKFEINKLDIRATKYVEKRKNKNWKDLQIVETRGIIEVDKWFKIINPKNPKVIKKYKYFKNS